MAGRFVISLDLELHWGVPHADLGQYADHLRGARAAVPRIIERLEQRGLGATWATVGALFARDRDELMAALPDVRPAYEDPAHDPWQLLAVAGHGEHDDVLRYGHSLVERVRRAPRQELASHTFAHIFCLEAGVTLEAVAADLRAARAIAEAHGDDVRSLVFPRNQYDDRVLAAARDAGFTAFRGNPDHVLYTTTRSTAQSRTVRAARLSDHYLPVVQEDRLLHTPTRQAGMVDIAASRFLRPISRRLAAAEPLRLQRIKREMTRAAETGRVWHLWWHPHNFGVRTDEHLALLDALLDHYDTLHDAHGMTNATMGQLAAQTP